MGKELWSPEEDEKLKQYILKHGCHSWNQISIKAGLRRGGKSCRLRWINYLRPGLRRCKFSSHEIKTVMDLHLIYGNRWSKIARYIEGRTDNDVKNIWNSQIRRQHKSKQNNNQNHNLTLANKLLVHSTSIANPRNYSVTQEKKESQEDIATNYQVQTMQPRKFPFSLDPMEVNVAYNNGINGQQEVCPLEPSSKKLLFSNQNLISMHSVKVNEDNHIKMKPNLKVDHESSMSHMTTLDKIDIKRLNYSCESLGLTITNEDHNESNQTLNYMYDSWIWYNNKNQINDIAGQNGTLMNSSMVVDDGISTINKSNYEVPPLPLPTFGNPSYLVSPILDPINERDYEIFNNHDIFT